MFRLKAIMAQADCLLKSSESRVKGQEMVLWLPEPFFFFLNLTDKISKFLQYPRHSKGKT